MASSARSPGTGREYGLSISMAINTRSDNVRSVMRHNIDNYEWRRIGFDDLGLGMVGVWQCQCTISSCNLYCLVTLEKSLP